MTYYFNFSASKKYERQKWLFYYNKCGISHTLLMKNLKSATLLLSIGCSDMMEESVNYAGYIKFLPMYLLSPFAIFPFLNWDNISVIIGHRILLQTRPVKMFLNRRRDASAATLCFEKVIKKDMAYTLRCFTLIL